MVNVDKHIAYWQKGADEDLEVGNQLVDSGKIRHGLFFLHLALEKLLKAHVCKHNKDIAPRMHNLIRLAELTEITFTQDQLDFMAEMNPYNIEGRYPELLAPLPSQEEILSIIKTVKELFVWLKNQL